MSLLALGARAARWTDAAPLSLRPAGPHHRVAAAGTRARGIRSSYTRARTRGPRQGRAAAAEGGRRPSRAHRPEHAAARGPPAVERPLPRHGHPRGRGLQPLARPGRDALARGCDVRRVRHVHLPARSRDGQLLVDRLSADADARPSATRRSSCRRAPNTAESITRIEAHTEISVSPEDDVEIRRVTLTNLSDDSREIEVTSYAEVVMAPLNADLAHRAFSNLFVQTEILPGHGAILCKRRPRDSAGADAMDVPSVGGARRCPPVTSRTRPTAPGS